MRRERALKVVLVLVGLLFTAMVYPLVLFVKQEPALAMMMSLYVTLGIFLIMAARIPSANRSLIAFTAWSSFAHATVMSFQAFSKSDRTRGTDRVGCARRHRCNPARAGSGKVRVVSTTPNPENKHRTVAFSPNGLDSPLPALLVDHRLVAPLAKETVSVVRPHPAR